MAGEGTGFGRRSRLGVALGATLALVASCGGGSGGGSGGGTSSGAIGQACLNGPRQTSDQRALCSCIQTAANRSLSAGDQRRAARFFADPQRAQDIRQSSRPADRAFWDRYRTFVTTAEEMCLPQGAES
jgi:hypothetical protein